MTSAVLEHCVNLNASLPSSAPRWQVAAARKCGSRHEASGRNCEDAYLVVQPMPGVLVIGVADGAGSAKFAEIGANIAVENGVAQVCSGLAQAGNALDAPTLREILEEAMAAALTAVQMEARTRTVDSRELASTMILVIALREFIAAAQIGDGATVVADQANKMFSLTTPPPGEYLNETVFLTSEDALQTKQARVWCGRASGVAVFSDGLQMLCVKWPEFEPHVAFFTPLFSFVRNTTDETAGATELTSFLHSERVGKLTDDDVTLVLAALESDRDEDSEG
jgi:Protein phosphatase 2C